MAGSFTNVLAALVLYQIIPTYSNYVAQAQGTSTSTIRRQSPNNDVKQHGRRQLQQQGSYNPPPGVQGSVDFFLLSGQSNMEGHSTSGQSLTKNDHYWIAIKSILEAGGDDADGMEAKLFDVIYEANSEVEDQRVTVAVKLAYETMRLYNAGLLNDLDTPLNWGTCSFVQPENSKEVYDISGGTKPTVWNANCGGSFGHELMFSRTLELDMGVQTHFETAKNARGGTQLYRDWYPGHGAYWNTLVDTVRSRKGYGNWKAFIWHQGTQEAWPVEDTSIHYLLNLTGLIEHVRAEMFDASEAATWQCKEEIPVVIVQIGYWPRNNRADRVRKAQRALCANDPRAELVIMDDLSRFYHFDAPSFLIGGHRIAWAYQAAMQGNVTCPMTSIPSFAPSPDFSDVPSPIPSSAMSAVPSSVKKNGPSFTWSSAKSDVPSPIPSSAAIAVPSSVANNGSSFNWSPGSLTRNSASGAVSNSAASAVTNIVTNDVPSLAPSAAMSAVPSFATSAVPSSVSSAVPSSPVSAVPSSATGVVPSSVSSFETGNGPSIAPSYTASAVPSSTATAGSSSTPSSIPSPPIKFWIYWNDVKCVHGAAGTQHKTLNDCCSEFLPGISFEECLSRIPSHAKERIEHV